MMKLMLAGVAALALSTGAAFAATQQPNHDYGNAPAQQTQLTQRYDYLSQQQAGTPSFTAQNNEVQGGYAIVSTPNFSWEGP